MVKLTPREQEVLGLMAEGKSNKEMGEILFVSEATTKTHVQNITGKLCAEGDNARLKAVILAHQQGLLDLSFVNIL